MRKLNTLGVWNMQNETNFSTITLLQGGPKK